MLHSRTIKPKMAALIALSKRKRVSYDVLQGLRTVDILYAENRKKKRSQVKYMGFYDSAFCYMKEHQTFLLFLTLQTSFFSA